MSGSRESTENVLKSWRYGQTQAERMCAGLLSIDGFTSIDPQCPLGGRDGLKDLLCEKGNQRYVAAVTFPSTNQTSEAIRDKFDHDLKGVRKNGADGLVFFVNQHVTPTQRENLKKRAHKQKTLAEIYHLERIRSLLDGPMGYGLRLEYLRIPMTPEEQLDFWHVTKDSISEALNQQATSFRDLTERIDGLMSTHATILDMLGKPQKTQPTTVQTGKRDVVPVALPPSSNLAPEVLFLIHRAVYLDHAVLGYVGCYRTVQNWIGPTEASSFKDATYVPPPAEDVPRLTEELLNHWNDSYSKTRQASHLVKTRAIADFHHGFLSIHPFLDGNGRVARVLLIQQVADIIGPDKTVALTERKAYFTALQKAHDGDKRRIRKIIREAISEVTAV